MTGQFSHNIDAKGRLFIPASLRKELGQTFHVTVGQDHCLSVYSDESWAAFMARLKELSYNEVKKLRALFASFDRAEIWSAERWAAIENEAFSSGALEQAMAEMGL